MRKTLWMVVAVVGLAGWVRGQTAPYLDADRPVDERVRDLISRLTLEEKATLLDHIGPDVERFKIRSDQWNQCLHGVVWDRPTTMFPVSIALAASWDVGLVHDVSDAISDEARGVYNLWHLQPGVRAQHKGLIYRAPVINISRNPYWGRINECYGEDPYLTGRVGVAYVKGLQGDDPKYLKLAATLKHYAVNNVEKDRQKLLATVSERMLHEYWLPHFRDCIVEGKAQSVMASYNAINGTPNNRNPLMLNEILKGMWGFKGFVVSDLGGVNTMVQGHEQGKMGFEQAVAQSMVAGCDFSDKEFRQYIPAAVRQGLLPEARLNDALLRVMSVRFRLGEFDPPDRVPYSKISPDVINSKEHRELALKAARESIVLLKNEGNLLPLDKAKVKKIAVIGPHADLFTAGGYSGRAENPVKPIDGIRNRAGSGVEVVYAKGAEILHRRNDPPFDKDGELKKAVEAAKGADVAIVYVGTTLDVEAEGRDRTTLALPGNQEELIEAVMGVQPRTVVVEMNAGPLCVPWVAEHVPAILEAWWGGEEGGNAMADVIFGNVDPGGKLPLTVYASEGQVPPQDEYDVTKGFTYMYLNGKPLFPFGHGLSYTKFEYSGLEVSSEVKKGGAVSIQVNVKNVGAREGDEVVQLYVHEVSPAVKRPVKQLRGFSREHLARGGGTTVTFTVPVESLAYWDEKVHGFVVKPGEFEVMVGASAEDVRGKGRIVVNGE